MLKWVLGNWTPNHQIIHFYMSKFDIFVLGVLGKLLEIQLSGQGNSAFLGGLGENV